MNLKKTLVLALLAAVSLVYVFNVMVPADRRYAARTKAFAQLDAARLLEISVNREVDGRSEAFSMKPGTGSIATPVSTSASSGDEDVNEQGPDAAERSADTAALGKWELSELKGAALDTNSLLSMVGTLRALDIGEGMTEAELEKDLGVYGLSKPALVVKVREESGTTEVAFGRKIEYLGKRYVKVSGKSGVFLADEASYSLLNKSQSDLRDKNPIKFDDADVRRVTVSSKGTVITMVQPSVGEWRIDNPGPYEASATAVAELLRTVKDLRVADFFDRVSKTDSQYGLSSPRVTVSVELRDGVSPSLREITLSSVKEKDADGKTSVYFTFDSAPSVFRTLADPFTVLEGGEDSLREKRLFKLSTNDVGKIAVSGHDISPIEISHGDIEWKVNGKLADPVFAEDVTQSVASLQVARFLKEAKEAVFEPPHRKIVVEKKGASAAPMQLVVGNQVPNVEPPQYFGRLEGSAEIFTLTEADVRRVTPREETLLAPTPTPVQAATGSPTPTASN